jgi:hypothetical protein
VVRVKSKKSGLDRSKQGDGFAKKGLEQSSPGNFRSIKLKAIIPGRRRGGSLGSERGTIFWMSQYSL